MSFNKFLQQALTDIKVKLDAEFKANFTRKAFFNEKWKNTKSPNSRGSLMLRTGNLRNSIRSELRGSSIYGSRWKESRARNKYNRKYNRKWYGKSWKRYKTTMGKKWHNPSLEKIASRF